MIDVEFGRSLLLDVPTHTPATGWVTSDYELITRISAGGVWFDLICPDWQAKYQAAEVLPTQRQTMSLRMAQKIVDFCAKTYVVGNYDFDCHSLVSFMMGWQDDVAACSAPPQRQARQYRILPLLPLMNHTSHMHPTPVTPTLTPL